jgi:hypothetical protein
VPIRDARFAYAGETSGRVTAYRAPGKRPVETLPARTSLGATVVLGIRGVIHDEGCEPSWYRVQLPIRPNGREAYVRADSLRVFRVSTRILVDLSARQLEVERQGKRVLTVPVAIGSSATPTPTGAFYVNQKVRVADAEGPYGPAVLGVSGFSNVLTGWAEGGPIAIHGTRDPESIGRAVSNGCVRVANDVVARLYEEIDAGTPVVIRA